MKRQVDITTGIPLSKSKSFLQQGKLKTTFEDDPVPKGKRFNKEKFLMWVVIGLIIIVMVYCAFFVGLKQTNFFGAETKNAQQLW